MINHSYLPRRSSGFSLIEVLIAVVVLSFGLLALAALQGALFKASAEAKAQSIGLGLAAEKLEFYRGFKDMATYRGIDSGSDASSVDVGGVAYSREWTVTRYAFRNADRTFVAVGNTGALSTATYAENNEFKRILVNVTWTNADNKTERVSLEEAIAALDPTDSAKLGKMTTGMLPRGPEVRIYNPTMQQQGVIPIAIGNGTDTAATNPKPLVNNTSVIETRFDVLTYNDLVGNTAVAQSRVETSLIGCSCSYGNALPGAMRPTYWEGTRYSVPETSAAVAGTGYASIAGSDPAASAQSSLCTICCRDHHDPAALPAGSAKFDPRDTTHSLGHQSLNVSTGALTSARSATGTYTESCRVIRVGGLFRVAADLYDDYQNFLDTKNDTSATAYLPTSAATANYQNFVKAYLRARVVNQPGQSSWNDILPITAPGAVSGLETANSVYATQPSAVSFRQTDPPKWLHLRGLYIDYLEDKALQAIKDAKDNCQGTGSGGAVTSSDLESCVLKVLPFTSINLTELGVYSPLSGNEIVVSNNNFYDTLSSTAPVRGKVSRGANPTPGTTTDATAKMRRSNTGLTTLPRGIDNDDNAASAPSTWTATQPYSIQGAGGGGGGGFRIKLTGYPFADNANTPYVNYPNTVCNYVPSATSDYTCTASVLTGGILTLGNYNFTVPVTERGMTLNCSNSSGTHTFSNGRSGERSINVCRNFSVAATPLIAVMTTPDGVLGESASVTYAAMVDGSTISLTATEQTQSDNIGISVPHYSAAYTCTYAGTNENDDDNYSVSAASCP